ncbi:hypothetical protein Tco_0924106 [Tanacetum coccineum]|uniref:Reverse transcriptase Ty1/copia-type domain-containing protein n=1 Tax=Tanacetum coccineum TaxID=301880 RepID=A0ABQ5D3Y4_9ASTR
MVVARRIVSSEEASLGDQEDASKQGRKIDDIDKDAEITLVDKTQGRYGDDLMFDTYVLDDEEVFVAEQGVSDKYVNLSVDEVTLAQALTALKSEKVQEKANVVEEPSESITTTPTLTTTTAATTITAASTRPRAKGLAIHEQKQAPTPIVSSHQQLQAKIQGLQVEFDEQERNEREKAEVNIALKETWDDIQAKIEADQLLAKRLQAKEEEELTIEERAILFQQLLERRRKHFAAKRAEKKRNMPPIKDQQRGIMCTYLKNMEGWKTKYLKSKSFANIQELLDKAMKKGKYFVGLSRTGWLKEVQRESLELKSLMEVIPNEEEVAVYAIPLTTKPPSIVDWKIYKEGKKSYYQIIKADESSKMYLVFSHMLKSFDIEDLETLYKLVKAKYGSTRPVEDLDLVLYGDLKTMFDPHVEDQVWKNQSDYKVLEWKLYDLCGVHSLRKQNVYIHMLVEKRYPLTTPTITDMLNRSLKMIIGMKCVISFLSSSQNSSRINEVFRSILLSFADSHDYLDKADNGKKNETKAYTFYRMENEEVYERYITSFKFGLTYEVMMNGDKVMDQKLLILIKGELYFVDFIVNPEDDVEPCVIFGQSFRKLVKSIIDFGNGILTIWPEAITIVSDDDELDALLASININELPPIDITNFPPFVCNIGKGLRNNKKPTKTYKMTYNGEGPSLTVNHPKTQEELTKEELEGDLYKRIMLLNEKRPIIETLKYGDKHKMLLDCVLLNKLKLDGELELEERLLENNYTPIKIVNVFARLDYDNELGLNGLIIVKNAWDVNNWVVAEDYCREDARNKVIELGVTGEELTKKKIIRFRLGGRAHFRSLLEFARHLGLYNVRKFWRKVFKFTFSGRSVAHTIRSLILRVMHKMITYGLCQRTTGGCRGKEWAHIRGVRLSLDATTLTEMIEPDGRLIAEDPAPGVPRGGVLEAYVTL